MAKKSNTQSKSIKQIKPVKSVSKSKTTKTKSKSKNPGSVKAYKQQP